MAAIEAPSERSAGPLSFVRDLTATHAANAVIGFAFAVSGPMAIILAAAAKGRLDEAEIASWIFGALFANGILTILFSCIYRMPLVFFWTIPGTVLVGQGFAKSQFAEIVGAFLVTGILMTALAVLGLVRRVMDALPLPVVMGMVAAVFLPFGFGWLTALHSDLVIAGPMTAAFLILSALPTRYALIPPLLGALAVGLVTLALLNGVPITGLVLDQSALARPLVTQPAFSPTALIELVIPLVITVLMVQNGQGIAILTNAGHRPPVNAIAFGCGVWSTALAPIGCVSTCLTGPVNAILTSGGARATQWTGAVVVGLLAIGFGAIAPAFTRAMLAAPPAFIATLAGLAMLRVLQSAFAAAFGGRYTLSALIAFLVSLGGVPLLNIGAPFWGLVAGLLVARTIERGDGRTTA
jgi:benzoate membrane transport protein